LFGCFFPEAVLTATSQTTQFRKNTLKRFLPLQAKKHSLKKKHAEAVLTATSQTTQFRKNTLKRFLPLQAKKHS